MSIRTLFILLFFLLFTVETALGQFSRLRDRAVNAAQDRLQQRVEERIYHEIDQAVYRAVDNAFDSVIGAPHERGDFRTEEEYQAAMNQWRMSLISMGADIEVRDEYSFSILNRMRISGTDEQGNPMEPVYLHALIEPDATYSGTTVPDQESGGEVVIIFDGDTNAMIMFIESDGEKMSMVYGGDFMLSAMEGLSDEFEVDEIDPADIPDAYAEKFTELGTKTIHGVQATGYSMEDEAVSVEYWITTEFGDHSVASGGGTQSPSTLIAPGIPRSHGALLLEARVIDKEEGSSFIMESVEIRRNAGLRFSSEDYPRIRLGE
ncbi:MAG: hypothetical protein EA360_12090 [Balneolaceae bacterium]|nr:MAG: hypothetical protein EA360_12090 [Balneolaceae bacterium]